ncbi:MAG: hypothetical protein LBC07_03305 [Elusimicrobiota bacterium]|nr:hypothetical protein [Elusimicrobiota bacterium]
MKNKNSGKKFFSLNSVLTIIVCMGLIFANVGFVGAQKKAVPTEAPELAFVGETDQLTPASRKSLLEFANAIKDENFKAVYIEVYKDKDSSNEEKLYMDRVQSVYTVLKEGGIPAAKMKYIRFASRVMSDVELVVE